MKRKFKGFVGLDFRGNILWGSFRIQQNDCKEFVEAHNPTPADHDGGGCIVPVTILLKDKK